MKGIVEIDTRYTWSRGLPKEPGHYWFRNTARYEDFNPRIIELRVYCGKISIQNCALKGFTRYEQGEWQPVQGPVE